MYLHNSLFLLPFLFSYLCFLPFPSFPCFSFCFCLSFVFSFPLFLIPRTLCLLNSGYLSLFHFYRSPSLPLFHLRSLTYSLFLPPFLYFLYLSSSFPSDPPLFSSSEPSRGTGSLAQATIPLSYLSVSLNVCLSS